MSFFLAPRSHPMGIFKTHILFWASQITLCNGLKAWSLSFLGLLYVKLTTVNVLILFPVKEINVCSGEVWNTAPTNSTSHSIVDGCLPFKNSDLLSVRRSWSVSKYSSYSKIPQNHSWHWETFSLIVSKGQIVQFTKGWESCFQYREFLNLSFSPNISLMGFNGLQCFPFLTPAF